MIGLERLRELADDMYGIDLWSNVLGSREDKYDTYNGDGKTVNGLLLAIADQIEAEQEERVTRRLEDREAAEWVRKHNGIEYVKAHWEGRVARSHVEHMAERQRERRERMQRHIEYIQRLCRERRERIVELNREIADMRPRLMPEGCEWPRYESGELVEVGDEVVGTDYGEHIRADEITFHANGFTLREKTGFEHWYESDDRFERPAVLAADGKPLEVGQTVYALNDDRLYTVKKVEDNRVSVNAGEGAYDVWKAPTYLTHQRPVLDADGAPIREGDTVWNATTSAGPFTVREIERSDDPDEPEDIVWCGEHAANGFKVWRIADQLTHAKPEIDTWQRIEEDALLPAGDYRERHGMEKRDGVTWPQQIREDLVRRCRALAERERGE